MLMLWSGGLSQEPGRKGRVRYCLLGGWMVQTETGRWQESTAQPHQGLGTKIPQFLTGLQVKAFEQPSWGVKSSY